MGSNHVVGDADDVIVRKDGRTEYVGTWEGRTFMVVIEDDGRRIGANGDHKLLAYMPGG